MRVERNNTVGLNKHAVTAITFYREPWKPLAAHYVKAADCLYNC